MVAQIIDYPWATLRRSLYSRYTLLDEICFAVLSPAFLFAAAQGYIDRGAWWSNAHYQSRLSSFLQSLGDPACHPVPRLTCCIPSISWWMHLLRLVPRKKPSFNLKQFWSRNDLTFLVVAGGLPWQAPAVSNASLHTFLQACQRVTLKPLPSGHTMVRHRSHNNNMTSTETNTLCRQ